MFSKRQIRTAILVAAAIILVPTFFFRGQWAPDEPRYASVAWHMRTTGDYVLPHINGELYPEKPPLFFYLAALADLVVAPDGGRVVEVAAMVLLAFLVAAFARGTGGIAPLAAPLILLTCLGSMGVGKFGVIDALLVALMVLAIAFGRAALQRENPIPAWLACYASLGLACLVKGPVIIPFAAFALVGSLAGLTIRGSGAKHLAGNLLGLLLFAGIIAAWLVPAWHAAPQAYKDRLIGQLKGRMEGSKDIQHLRGWYFYFTNIGVSFFPWILALVAAIDHSLRRQRRNQVLFVWFIGSLLLLSLFGDKQLPRLFLVIPWALAFFVIRRQNEAEAKDLRQLWMFGTALYVVQLAVLLLAPGWYSLTKTLLFVSWTGALVRAVRQSREEEGRDFWLLLWFLAGFLLLSVFASKRERYVFNILPAGVVLLAHYLARGDFDRFGRAALRLTAAILVAGGVALCLAAPVLYFLPDVAGDSLTGPNRVFFEGLQPWLLWIGCPLFGIVALAGGLIAWGRRGSFSGLRFVLGTFLFFAAVNLSFDVVFTPALDPLKSGTQLTRHVSAYAETGGKLYMYDKHYDGRFNRATGRVHIEIVRNAEAARKKLNVDEPAALVILWEHNPDDPEQMPLGPDFGHVLGWGYMGHSRTCLLGNDAANKVYPSTSR